MCQVEFRASTGVPSVNTSEFRVDTRANPRTYRADLLTKDVGTRVEPISFVEKAAILAFFAVCGAMCCCGAGERSDG